MAEPKDEREELEELKHREPASTGLEGAADEDAGVIRHADVEGGEDISIDAGPPSFAGGVRGSPVPNRSAIREGED